MIEKEINLRIKDFDGLIEYLNTLWIWEEKRITFHYFNKESADFYVRIEERQNWSFVTVKSFNKTDTAIKSRKEVTTPVNNIEDFIDIFQLMWMEYSWIKSKVRIEYLIGELKLDIDSWYVWRFEEFIESRLEIEWDDETKILEFADSISDYAERTNEDLKK